MGEINYIIFEKFLGLACVNVPLMLINKEARTDYCGLMHITLSLFYTQGRKQIISLLSLTCHLVLYGCSHKNL